MRIVLLVLLALLVSPVFGKSEYMNEPYRYTGSAQKDPRLVYCLSHVEVIQRFQTQVAAQQDFEDWILAHQGNQKAEVGWEYQRLVSEMIAVYFAAEGNEAGAGHGQAMARCMGTGT